MKYLQVLFMLVFLALAGALPALAGSGCGWVPETRVAARLFWQSVSCDVLAECIKSGDVKLSNSLGATPLHQAVMYSGRLQIIEALLAGVADRNLLDKDGKTALIYAAERSFYPAVPLALLEAGAALDVRDLFGKRAVDYALQNDNLQGSEVLARLVAGN